MWGYDLRADDTPIESNLGFVCRKSGGFKGHEVVEKQRLKGVQKRLVYFTIDEKKPLWGLEGVYRNGTEVGHLRRGEFGYSIGKSIGKSFIHRNDGQPINDQYLQGDFEIDVMGKRYPAKLHLKAPFDTENQRILGYYNSSS